LQTEEIEEKTIVKRQIVSQSCIQVHSKKKTTIAVLRLLLGLTVEEFAVLIGKSVSAVTSLETGRLKLSEETAFEVSRQTGVAMAWLLAGAAKEKPYAIDEGDNSKRSFTKELFESVQAHKMTGGKYARTRNPERRLVGAISVVSDWISVYNAAAGTGKAELAVYLMQRFLSELIERLGKDDDDMIRINQNARIITADGLEWAFVRDNETDSISLEPVGKKAA
jgi:transcriptional regulator with XRE-family HTH domain